jgi:hypothetical protein
MSSRTFTLDEAQMLLPVLESLLKRAIQSKTLMEEVDNEFQENAHRVFLNGGTLVNVVHLARRKAERGKAMQRIKDALAEIDATGVQVKDLDIGLLDFPCQVDGEIVHWHSTTEGFAGRRLIDDRIANAGKKRTNKPGPGL